jgi:hypothetical protein
MKFLVVIDRDSPIGQAYDAWLPHVLVGQHRHPAFVCTAMDPSNPWYMFVRTEPTTKHPAHQSIHLPHGSVLFVVQYAEDEQAPFGFC